MPTSDAAMVALDAPVAHLLDKRSLATAAVALGLATPPAREFNDRAELAAAAPDLDYPVVVKPAVSRFSPFRADGPEGLHVDRLVDCPLLVQPFIVDELRAFSGVIWAGRLVAASHQRYIRTWPTDCGGASMAESVPPDLDLEERVVELLSGHEGLFMAQFAGPYLLDLNPRPYGSLPLAVAAGANLPALYCDLLLGCEPPVRPVRARPGVRYRWLEGDLRSIARRLRQGNMSLRSAAHELTHGADRGATVETWRDPRPAGVRLAYAASHRPK
jgi:predicted ATP-grasp superfamily ATP-dependent carboligase